MSAHVHRRADCRLCGGKQLELVVPITATPVADAYVTKEQLQEPQECFSLDMHQCLSCGHVQLLDVVDPQVLFGHYSYFSGRSAGLVKHFQEYADDIMRRTNLPPRSLIVEIGSNDGCFLQFFQRQGHQVLGVDPAKNIAEVANSAGVETWPEFFDLNLAKRIQEERGRAQVVVANNVFAHTDDMAGMAEAVRSLLADDGVFVFEVSYLLDVIDHMLLGTIFHEHVCYHSVTPLDAFLLRHGLELIHVQRVSIQGGSLICTAQKSGGSRKVDDSVSHVKQLELQRALHKPQTLREFSRRLEVIRTEFRNWLTGLKPDQGSMAAFGAARGGTLLVYHFGLGELIEFIVDDSPDKQQLYSPGYHIPVLPTSALYERRPSLVFILAWVHTKQIVQNHQRFLDEGGKFITCFPRLEVIQK